MADVTVSELAKTVGVAVERLLSQVKEAGLPHTKADDPISNEDKNTLLLFLRRSHGDKEATDAAPRKITLKRKTVETLKSASSHGRGKTVAVEVRKKRTYVKRSELQPEKEEVAPVEEQVEAVDAEFTPQPEPVVVPEDQAVPEQAEAPADETPAVEVKPAEAEPVEAPAPARAAEAEARPRQHATPARGEAGKPAKKDEKDDEKGAFRKKDK